MHPNTTKLTTTWVQGLMGWITCIRCQKFRCEFVAWSFALIASVQPVLHRISCSYETNPKCTQTVRNEPILEFRVQWGWIGCVRCEKFRRDFVARTFALVKHVLLRVSCSNKKNPKCTQILQNEPIHDFWVQWGRSGAFVAKNSDANLWHKLVH